VGAHGRATAPSDTEPLSRVKAVLAGLRLASACGEAHKCVAYMERNCDRIRCVEFRAAELCLSSGEVGGDYISYCQVAPRTVLDGMDR